MAARRIVTKHTPTQIGDVLILSTARAYTLSVVGRISRDGQEDFYGQGGDANYMRGRTDAVAVAKTLLVPGRRIFIRDIDTDNWSEISG